jgi:hypothetical protein
MSVDRRHLRIAQSKPPPFPKEEDIELAVCNALACAGDIDTSYIFVSAHVA